MPRRSGVTTLALLGVLAVLAAAAFLLEGLPGRGREEAGGEPLLPRGEDEITRLEIRGPASEVTLLRSPGGWEADRGGRRIPADGESVGKVLRMLTSPGPLAVSRRPSTHAGFQVDDRGATTLTAWAGERRALALKVGRQGPDLFSNYVRREGSDEVLLVKGYYRGLLDRRPGGWLDLALTSFAGTEVSGIDLRRPGRGDLSLRREADGWRRLSPRPGPAEAGAVDELIGRLSALRGTDVPGEGQGDSGEELLGVRLTLSGGGQQGFAVRRWPGGEDLRLVRRDGAQVPCLVSVHAVADLEGLFDRLSE